MDRIITYPGQIPLASDVLYTARNGMVGNSKLAETVLGTAVVVDGFTCIETTPASLNVSVTPGVVQQLGPVDQVDYGSLAADVGHQIAKQGLLKDALELTLVPPVTNGHAINYLVQVGLSETDDQPAVLPYYNSTNPAQPYSGPNNSGVAQNKRRTCVAAIQLKSGVSATSGTQVTPTPDPGFVPLFVITVAYGDTAIHNADISRHDDAPFLIAKLPEVPFRVQEGTWIYADDTGAADALAIELYPIPAIPPKQLVVKKIASDNTAGATLEIAGLGTYQIVQADGAPLAAGFLKAGQSIHLTFDGTSYQLANIHEALWGGGTNPATPTSELANVGSGQAVWKGLNVSTNKNELRSVSGLNGIAVALNGPGTEIVVDGAALAATAAAAVAAAAAVSQTCLAPGVATGTGYTWAQFASDADVGIWELKCPAFAVARTVSGLISGLYLQVSFDNGSTWSTVLDFTDTGQPRYLPLAMVGAYTSFGGGGGNVVDTVSALARIAFTKSVRVGGTYYNVHRFGGGVNHEMTLPYQIQDQGPPVFAADASFPNSGGARPRIRVALVTSSGDPGAITWGTTPSLCRVA